MNKNRITLSLAAALALGFSANTTAAGFQLAEYSATGLGRAFAGEAAMADNASAQFRNPALLTYLKGTQISAGAIYVNPNVDIKGSATPHAANGNLTGDSVESNADDIAHGAVIPNFYLSHQINDTWAAGLALATNYGMETELSGDFKGTQFGNEAMVKTVEINPNLAYKVNNQWHIGGGVRYVLGEGHFGAVSSADTYNQNRELVLKKGATLKYMEGDDTAWGWQLGTVWQINDAHRIGFNYRSKVDFSLEGHAEGAAFRLMPDQQLPGSMDLSLPATAELASHHQLSDKLAVHASLNWTDWSSFKKLAADINTIGTVDIKEENWEDNYRLALGTTYQLNNKTVLRGGVAYDTSAVNDTNRTLTIPETDRLWLSTGVGYRWSERLTMDAGFTYIFAEEAPVNEPRNGIASDQSSVPFGGTYQGEIQGNIWLVGVQANYRF
ncbi:outer membrane protein transport protein [Photobacterium atrarenae]|uniref:Outer membrane protein transport protein n=1 Tax=Photobacterium atrarenae TaxID=865757 RepID=A0ABY5GI90_9GAMM|nr:outer membrane protein transport protein [Photobacterium atrarenae]UTV28419.1 outer membrane protein transport protein [Photobacterium atrarenae]